MLVRVKLTRHAHPDCGSVATLDMEEYLRGVVPSEMLAGSPPEALKAQAVAARTWALRRVVSRAATEWDVDDTSACQVYRPYDRIDARTDAAVAATAGLVLTYGGKPIDAVYGDSNGGHSVSARERWGSAVPYLIAQPDPYDPCTLPNGHGVGLSQRGAAEAARQGLGFEAILAFYYPGTTLGLWREEDAMRKTYSLQTEGDMRLSPNFRVKEFACKDGSDLVLADDALVEALQTIRGQFHSPVHIVSGYRTPAYNSGIGGASGSKHLLGEAADIRVAGIAAADVAVFAERLGLGGVGLYAYADAESAFVHVDVRTGEPVRWMRTKPKGEKNRYVESIAATLEAETPPKAAQALCKASQVHLREAPHTSAPILGKLEKGQSLWALPVKDGWRQVAAVLGRELMVGYVVAAYVG